MLLHVGDDQRRPEALRKEDLQRNGNLGRHHVFEGFSTGRQRLALIPRVVDPDRERGESIEGPVHIGTRLALSPFVKQDRVIGLP